MTLEDENEKAKNAATQECPSTEESNATLENSDPSTPGTDYPSGLRLTSLIVGLCLSVLLVALVSIVVDTEFMPLHLLLGHCWGEPSLTTLLGDGGAVAMLTAIFAVRIPKQKNPSEASSGISYMNELDPIGTVCFLPGVAIKGVSAVKSGIMCLPMILSVVIFSLVAGGVIAIGHYVPFAYASCILTTIGAGLITTFETNTRHPKWIGYQFLFGAGVGCGIQLGIIASQVVLEEADIAI
ncbi:ABC transporter [Fusarium mundagurra]|uniref:ABC transporter n=1 Tax=Fusarium mundagurra TaxID=1567541 RepID=A0A8H5XNL3_9HYPO|nr:ABC transporter [Fusarium mundagurra]